MKQSKIKLVFDSRSSSHSTTDSSDIPVRTIQRVESPSTIEPTITAQHKETQHEPQAGQQKTLSNQKTQMLRKGQGATIDDFYNNEVRNIITFEFIMENIKQVHNRHQWPPININLENSWRKEISTPHQTSLQRPQQSLFRFPPTAERALPQIYAQQCPSNRIIRPLTPRFIPRPPQRPISTCIFFKV